MATSHDMQEQVVLDAERSVLGAMLLHPGAVHDATDLTRADWLLPRHAEIHRAILAALNTTGKTDALTVADQLRQRGHLEECGGHDYLLDLFDSVVTAASVKRHAEIVLDAANRRRVGERAADVARAAKTGVPLDELVGMLEQAKPRPVALDSEAVQFTDWLALVERPPVQWMVQRLVPAASIVVFAGDTQAGKSFVAIDLALRLLHGRDFLGHRMQPGSVLYFCGEGQDGFAARLRVWKQQNVPHADEAAGRYLKVSDSIPRLGSAHMQKFRREIELFIKARGHAPALVVIDTLSQGLDGDENDAQVTAPVLRALAKMRQEFGCTFMIVHHVVKGAPPRGKEKNDWRAITLNDVRGSGAITRNVDTVLGVHRARDGQAWELVVLKQKDGRSIDPIRFERLPVNTGLFDNFGDEESSCIIIPATATAADVQTPEQQLAEVRAQQRSAILATLRSLGGTVNGVREVTGLIPGPPKELEAAFQGAVSSGEIIPKKVRGQRTYVLAEQGAHGAPAYREKHTGAPPSPENDGMGAAGGGNDCKPQSAPRRPLDMDDGQAEQPKGRRRSKVGGIA
jgi:hypothetical protein